MNVPRCRNCNAEVKPDERICLSCGATQWGECTYCGKETAPDLGSQVRHELNCEENPRNSPSGSLLEP